LAGFSETAKLVEERDFKGARERLEKFMDDADAMLPNFPEGDIMQRTMEEDALAQLMTTLIGNLDFLED
jgi:sugar/nucleoside kinase (ribokinase family)